MFCKYCNIFCKLSYRKESILSIITCLWPKNKLQRKYLKKRETTSALPDFDAAPLTWSNWNLEMLLFLNRGKPGNPEKNLWSKREPVTMSPNALAIFFYLAIIFVISLFNKCARCFSSSQILSSRTRLQRRRPPRSRTNFCQASKLLDLQFADVNLTRNVNQVILISLRRVYAFDVIVCRGYQTFWLF